MTDTKKLESIPPIKSVEELQRDTENHVNADPRTEGDERSAFTPILAPNLFIEPNVGGPVAGGLNASRGSREDDTVAAPRETTENTEG